MKHPREVLLGAQGGAITIPVCDHYCGTELRMRKALALQAEMSQEFGTCVFDVTLDCEDGAPVGGEAEHAHLVAELAASATTGEHAGARVAVRVHPVNHPAFAGDIEVIAAKAGSRLCHIMLPKVESIADIDFAEKALQRTSGVRIPLHILIESPAAVQQAFALAAHPAVQSISFGLMDFVSAHGGAIPASAMTYASADTAGQPDQFTHPLVLRAKLEIAAACHAHGKVPSHCVVTEWSDPGRVERGAFQAANALGYTRMWSIHPSQIRPILAAFAPSTKAVEDATKIIVMAARSDWAPISFDHVLHDRASYRYYWQVLERAHQTGQLLPAEAQPFFAAQA